MPENCANRFMSAFFSGSQADMACIDELCRLALSEDESSAAAGVKALYGSIVEGLCDDFSERGVSLCNQVLLRLIFTLIRQGKAPGIEKLLQETGPSVPQALLQRYAELRRASLSPLPEAPQCFLVLSRVSIGADILITSIIVQRLRTSFPESEVVLLGPAHLSQLFSEQPRIGCLPIRYERNGSLLERIGVSARVRAVILGQCRLFGAPNVVLVDPDSRLSQLGLMPLLPLSQSRYFCSRQEQGTTDRSSLAQICNRWLDRWTGNEGDAVYPRVFFSLANRRAAADFAQQLRRHRKHFVVINLGVGRNERKRIGGFFEEHLLLELLQRPDLLVVLDSGSSPAGAKRAERLMEKAAERGYKTILYKEEELTSGGLRTPIRHELVGIKSSIGLLGALIAEADCFFGYDSSCQHLACACSTPGVELFAGHPSERFLNRWQPSNRLNSIEVFSCPREGEMHLHESAKLVEEVARAIDGKISPAAIRSDR